MQKDNVELSLNYSILELQFSGYFDTDRIFFIFNETINHIINFRYLFYTPPPAKHSNDNSIYQFSVKDIDGNVVSLDQYHDKVLQNTVLAI